MSQHFIVEYADEDDGEYDREELEAIFAEALHALAHSPTFDAMVAQSGKKPWTIMFDDMMQGYGSIEPDERVIYLTSHASPAQLVSTLTHEMRHAFQYENALGTELADHLKKRDFIVWNMLIEADAASTEAQVIAEIDHTELGAKAKKHSAKMPHYQAIHGAFNRTAAKDPESLEDGRAQLAAFKKFFRTKLVGIYTAGFGEYFKELRKEGFVANRMLPDKAARALGWHRTGGNYLDKDPKLANRTGKSLRSNDTFFGKKQGSPGRNQRAMDPRRKSLKERCDAILMPSFMRPPSNSRPGARPLRPF